MSGPIVRSGPTPTYSKNFDQVFGPPKKNNAKEEKKPEAKVKSSGKKKD